MVSEVTIPKNSKQTLLLVEKVTVQKLVIDSYFYSLKLVSTIVGRGFLTPLFYGDPVPPKLLPPPPPLFSSFWLNGWSRHIWCAIWLNDIRDLHMSSLVALVPEGPWCVFYATMHQVYWGPTHNVFFRWYSNLISHTHTHTHSHIHTNKDAQHTQGPVGRHTHINIYLHHVLCAHSSYLYHVKWIILWCQKFTFHNVLYFQIFFTCKSHISLD